LPYLWFFFFRALTASPLFGFLFRVVLPFVFLESQLFGFLTTFDFPELFSFLFQLFFADFSILPWVDFHFVSSAPYSVAFPLEFPYAIERLLSWFD